MNTTELKVDRETFCTGSAVLDTSVEQSVEKDFVLPDYCADIFRILKCIVSARVLSQSVNGGKLSFEMCVTARVLYCSENLRSSDENTYKSVIQQYFGVQDEDELKDKLSLEYKRNKAVEEYIENHLKDDEIKKYYDENITGEIKASHILISIDAKENATDEEKEAAEKKAEKTAKNIIKKLNKGEDFSKLAKKYSTDQATSSNGGDLGYFQPSDMTTAFADAVKELKIKEYTKEPVKTEYGYHIILKTGEKDKPKLKSVKTDIKEKIRTEKMQNDSTLYYTTLDEIRNESKITWNDSTLKKAYKEYMNKLIENAKSTSS